MANAIENMRKLAPKSVYSYLENKRRLQKIVFADGIYYNVQKHIYLTSTVNQFVWITSCIAKECTKNENGNFQCDAESSRIVLGTGQLSDQIISDLQPLASLQI